MARSEVVDGKAHAHGAQSFHHLRSTVGIAHHHALGDLDFDQVRRHPGRFHDGTQPCDEIGLMELTRGKVHRNRHRDAQLLPAACTFANMLQRPVADGDDRADLFGQRDELVGQQQSRVGWRQRISASTPETLFVMKSIFGWKKTSISLRSSACRRPASSERRSWDSTLGSAAYRQKRLRPCSLARYIAMSAFEMSVCASAPVAGECADADAYRQPQLLAVHHHARREGAQHLVGNLGQFVRVVEVLDEQHELVTSQARHEVARPHRCRKASRGLLEHAVSERMAKRVVHILEAVEVQEEEREAAVMACRLRRGHARALR